MRTKRVDRPLLLSIIALVIAGFFIFSSAAMGLLARQGISFSTVALKQFAIGFVAGGLMLIAGSKIPYKFWRKHAFYILLIGLFLSILVFIPHIGFRTQRCTSLDQSWTVFISAI
jgi:cell division protein FtsW (lipid II flippase)